MPVARIVRPAALAVGLTALSASTSAAQSTPPEVTTDQVMTWLAELSNWGRWGDDDQLGSLNLITDAKRRAAAELVSDGAAVSLARDMSKEASPENNDPLEHDVRFSSGALVGWGSDSYAFNYHGYDFSHLDALPHTAVEGRLYNGYSAESVAPGGAEQLGIQVVSEGVFTRGVLIDLPRLLGVDFLEPGTAITVEELERWERESGVTIEPGDVLLIRTGRWAKRAADGGWRAGGLLAGLHASTAPWLRGRDVAAIGCDGVTDVLPSEVQGFSHPLHQILLVGMGTPLFDNLDLEELAEEAAARGRATFLFTAAPIRFPGGLGSPVNPLAVF